jgi:hypothetical protein
VAIEDERRVAERAVGDRDRPAAERVVDDLVPHQDLERVGAGLATELDGQHRLAVGEPLLGVGLRGGLGLVDRGDAVTRRAARLELRQRHAVLREICLPAARVELERLAADAVSSRSALARGVVARDYDDDQDDRERERDDEPWALHLNLRPGRQAQRSGPP